MPIMPFQPEAAAAVPAAAVAADVADPAGQTPGGHQSSWEAASSAWSGTGS